MIQISQSIATTRTLRLWCLWVLCAVIGFYHNVNAVRIKQDHQNSLRKLNKQQQNQQKGISRQLRKGSKPENDIGNAAIVDLYEEEDLFLLSCYNELGPDAAKGTLSQNTYAEFLINYCYDNQFRGKQCFKNFRKGAKTSFDTLDTTFQLNFVKGLCPDHPEDDDTGLFVELHCLQNLIITERDFFYIGELDYLCETSFLLMTYHNLLTYPQQSKNKKDDKIICIEEDCTSLPKLQNDNTNTNSNSESIHLSAPKAPSRGAESPTDGSLETAVNEAVDTTTTNTIWPTEEYTVTIQPSTSPSPSFGGRKSNKNNYKGKSAKKPTTSDGSLFNSMQHPNSFDPVRSIGTLNPSPFETLPSSYSGSKKKKEKAKKSTLSSAGPLFFASFYGLSSLDIVDAVTNTLSPSVSPTFTISTVTFHKGEKKNKSVKGANNLSLMDNYKQESDSLSSDRLRKSSKSKGSKSSVDTDFVSFSLQSLAPKDLKRSPRGKQEKYRLSTDSLSPSHTPSELTNAAASGAPHIFTPRKIDFSEVDISSSPTSQNDYSAKTTGTDSSGFHYAAVALSSVGLAYFLVSRASSNKRKRECRVDREISFYDPEFHDDTSQKVNTLYQPIHPTTLSKIDRPWMPFNITSSEMKMPSNSYENSKSQQHFNVLQQERYYFRDVKRETGKIKRSRIFNRDSMKMLLPPRSDTIEEVVGYGRKKRSLHQWSQVKNEQIPNDIEIDVLTGSGTVASTLVTAVPHDVSLNDSNASQHRERRRKEITSILGLEHEKAISTKKTSKLSRTEEFRKKNSTVSNAGDGNPKFSRLAILSENTSTILVSDQETNKEIWRISHDNPTSHDFGYKDTTGKGRTNTIIGNVSEHPIVFEIKSKTWDDSYQSVSFGVNKDDEKRISCSESLNWTLSFNDAYVPDVNPIHFVKSFNCFSHRTKKFLFHLRRKERLARDFNKVRLQSTNVTFSDTSIPPILFHSNIQSQLENFDRLLTNAIEDINLTEHKDTIHSRDLGDGYCQLLESSSNSKHWLTADDDMSDYSDHDLELYDEIKNVTALPGHIDSDYLPSQSTVPIDYEEDNAQKQKDRTDVINLIDISGYEYCYDTSDVDFHLLKSNESYGQLPIQGTKKHGRSSHHTSKSREISLIKDDENDYAFDITSTEFCASQSYSTEVKVNSIPIEANISKRIGKSEFVDDSSDVISIEQSLLGEDDDKALVALACSPIITANIDSNWECMKQSESDPIHITRQSFRFFEGQSFDRGDIFEIK